jgi:4-oxalocrotonate tautomerase
MPLSRISVRAGKPVEYRKALGQGVQRALIDIFSVPADDLFQVITEHDEASLIFDGNYMGIARSDDFVMVQITVSNTRTVEQKKALYARIADYLADSPGVRREDVFVNLVDVAKENWSFGNGIAQYAV